MYHIGYLILILCILLLPLLLSRNYISSIYPVFIIIFYILAFLAFLLYVAKDFNHLHLILKYYSYSPKLMKKLILFPLPLSVILRILNFFCLCFIEANIFFVSGFSSSFNKKFNKIIKITTSIFFILEFILYDPSLYIHFYTALYPVYINSKTIISFYRIFEAVTLIFNNLCLVYCVSLFVYFFVVSPKIRSLRNAMLSFCISYISLITTYILILFWSPALLIRYSKIADIVTYVPLTLRLAESFYFIFPYILLILFAFFVYNFLRYYRIRQKITSSSLKIMHTVQGASTSSRLFCHYIKNELLSLNALLEEIPITPENKNIMGEIENQYKEIYTRINTIHESLKSNTFKFETVPVNILINTALEDIKKWKKVDEIHIITQYPVIMPKVIVDKVEFTHALVNIIQNAVESMLCSDKPTHVLQISVAEEKKYVITEIYDNGIGIPEKDLENIFTPLFSTKPQTNNWGMGLSLAYTIITMCGGKISVSSTEKKGCTFEIQLINASSL